MPFILGLLIIICNMGCIDQLVPQEVTIGELLTNYNNYTKSIINLIIFNNINFGFINPEHMLFYESDDTLFF